MNTKPMRIYLSGAITGTNDYMERFAEAERILKNEGYMVVNPAKVCEPLADASYTWHEYMQVCFALLETCTHIYLMTGWQDSKGACAEEEFAKENGISRVSLRDLVGRIAS